MTPSHVIEVLRTASASITASYTAATGGDWWPGHEVVHAPHWHPARQGEVCYPLIAQSGGDPEADAHWGALMAPHQVGPAQATLLGAVADLVQVTGDVDTDVVRAALMLAERVLRHSSSGRRATEPA